MILSVNEFNEVEQKSRRIWGKGFFSAVQKTDLI